MPVYRHQIKNLNDKANFDNIKGLVCKPSK